MRVWYSLHGMQIGKNTTIEKAFITWPHQIKLGCNCKIEHNVFFKFDGIWTIGPSIILDDRVFVGTGSEFNIQSSLYIGKDSLIASGCKFIDHDHGINASLPIRVQVGKKNGIYIGHDVWLGCNVVVLKGVCISDGAIVGAGSVVTKSIPSLEIWAGVPAKKIGNRN